MPRAIHSDFRPGFEINCVPAADAIGVNQAQRQRDEGLEMGNLRVNSLGIRYHTPHKSDLTTLGNCGVNSPRSIPTNSIVHSIIICVISRCLHRPVSLRLSSPYKQNVERSRRRKRQPPRLKPRRTQVRSRRFRMKEIRQSSCDAIGSRERITIRRDR